MASVFNVLLSAIAPKSSILTLVANVGKKERIQLNRIRRILLQLAGFVKLKYLIDRFNIYLLFEK
jgi:hypothetical protein